MDEKKIGERINKLRLNKKMTLESLANVTGFTSGYLSRIENSENAPPISTLSKIGQALEVDISFLLFEYPADSQRNMVIVRKDDPKELVDRKASFGYRYEALADKKVGKNMEPYILYPDFEYSTIFQHEGEEFFYILEGRVEFVYGDVRYVLETGDSMYFDAHIPHSGISLGDQKAKILIIIYSYKRR
jgi:transcriptional regulator with XRE-family HTH domain